jgi:hypothetical protein
VKTRTSVRFASLERFLSFCLAVPGSDAVSRAIHGGWVFVNDVSVCNPLLPISVGDAVEIRPGCPGISDGSSLAFVATPGVLTGALTLGGHASSCTPGRLDIERVAERVARA